MGMNRFESNYSLQLLTRAVEKGAQPRGFPVNAFSGLEVGSRMRNSIISAGLGLALLLVPGARAQEEAPVELADNPPERYTVVKGDTLWGISKRFLKDPWRWPDLWGMNKDEVRNPHRIYPGNVLILDLSGATPRLRLEGDGPGGVAGLVRTGAPGSTVKLSPRVRAEQLAASPVPSIPATAIAPFLNRPLIVDRDQFESAPRIVATQENRVVAGAGDTVFVKGLEPDAAMVWQVYRPGKPLVDPVSRETLGYEVTYLGDLRVREFGEISTAVVARARQEIGAGDRLVLSPPSDILAYMPRAASGTSGAMVISAPDTVITEIGQQQVVVINRGVRDGVEVGNVFALYRSGQVVVPRSLPTSSTNEAARINREIPSVQKEFDMTRTTPVQLPAERYGLVFVFRVFERVSYALVMNATRPVNLLDLAQAP
jgi:hypothetical protein